MSGKIKFGTFEEKISIELKERISNYFLAKLWETSLLRFFILLVERKKMKKEKEKKAKRRHIFQTRCKARFSLKSRNCFRDRESFYLEERKSFYLEQGEDIFLRKLPSRTTCWKNRGGQTE
ncbi:hypothetical protein CEXT_378791 [Caerostris extrusa]|uniref:Uncharacterized protein n=1 Tax=Caerostris extrusa TaxID=172846 RepID=A0AAV4SMB1_CAEEX|nr:hypothetical protein CEXT_378791 [Caerostris extrusa]